MNTSFTDQMKSRMAEWQKQLEEMRVQFSLGKMDAADAFEKQKDHLKEILIQLKASLDDMGKAGEAQLTEYRSKLESVLLQLSLGKADGMDMFADQKKKIEQALQDLTHASKDAYNKGFEESLRMFDYQTTAFKTGLEIVQLQFALAKMDAADEADKLKQEMNQKIHELQDMWHQGQKLMTDHLLEWNKQALDGYEKFKTWANQWTKP